MPVPAKLADSVHVTRPVPHLETPSKRRRRRRRSQKVREILENGAILTVIALVVGVLIFVFNPPAADASKSPIPDGKLLKP